MEVLREALSSECSLHPKTHAPCAKRWLPAALEMLSKNNIDPISFARQVVNTLTKGRGKGSNLFIVGPANCVKSFVLMPLSITFDCFFCPSNSKFNFVTDIDKEIIFFNDLRYGPNGKGDDKFLPWNQFLNLLESAPVNVAMPKNLYASDQEWTALQPIFATSNQCVVSIINGKIDYGETDQMNEMWNYIEFSYQCKKGEIYYSLCPCARCFAQLIFDYSVTN